MVKKNKTSKSKGFKESKLTQSEFESQSIDDAYNFLVKSADYLLKVRCFSRRHQHEYLKVLTEPMISEILEILYKIDQKQSPYGNDEPEETVLRALSPRELECLKWCALGKTYWETGAILGISERTVDFHMTSVREKMNTTTNAHSVAQTLRKGLI